MEEGGSSLLETNLIRLSFQHTLVAIVSILNQVRLKAVFGRTFFKGKCMLYSQKAPIKIMQYSEVTEKSNARKKHFCIYVCMYLCMYMYAVSSRLTHYVWS